MHLIIVLHPLLLRLNLSSERWRKPKQNPQRKQMKPSFGTDRSQNHPFSVKSNLQAEHPSQASKICAQTGARNNAAARSSRDEETRLPEGRTTCVRRTPQQVQEQTTREITTCTSGGPFAVLTASWIRP